MADFFFPTDHWQLATFFRPFSLPPSLQPIAFCPHHWPLTVSSRSWIPFSPTLGPGCFTASAGEQTGTGPCTGEVDTVSSLTDFSTRISRTAQLNPVAADDSFISRSVLGEVELRPVWYFNHELAASLESIP